MDFVSATDRDAHTENNECGHVPEIAPGTIDDRKVKEIKRQKILADSAKPISLPGPTPVQQTTLEVVTQYTLSRATR